MILMLKKWMNKILLILFFLLVCSNSFAKILSFKCEKIYSRDGGEANYENSDIMLIQIDTNKREIHEYSDTMSRISPKWKISKVTEFAYESNEVIDFNNDGYTSAHFNRWTGEFISQTNIDSPFYKYSCEPTRKLY